MKTSSKIILESISIPKELRINAELLGDEQLKRKTLQINSLIDDLNNQKNNELEKIFLLEEIIKQLIEFSTHLFNKLIFKDDERRKEKLRVKRLKSFIDIQGKVEDELPMPDDDEDDVPVIPSALKRKLNL
jgi:hypothetical protein|tara:strand:+ start:167 stop:559 length:393 start_codon:yes stop_codon:yes gene_type:complete